MNSKLLIATTSYHTSRAISLIIAVFISLNVAAQTPAISDVKPQAILLAELTDFPVAAPLVPISLINRKRIINHQRLDETDETKIDLPNGKLLPSKIVEILASLKPTLLEEQAFKLVNDQRAALNLQLLKWDLEMLYLARQHSENMAKLIFFSHQGRDGKTVADRSLEIGVTDWRAIGENLAFNQGVENTIEFSVRCWMNSNSHKQNLLGKNWTRSGIGIFETADGKFYITQVFRD